MTDGGEAAELDPSDIGIESDEPTESEVELQLAIIELKKNLVLLATLFVGFLTINFVPIFILVISIIFETVLTNIPVINYNPPSVALTGTGTKVTTLANGLAVIVILKNAIHLYMKGTPTMEIVIEGGEDDG